MKKMIILLFIVMFIVMFMLCGRTNRECVKSHEEEELCVWYTPILAGKTTIMFPHYYPCTKTICDEYRVTENE